MNNNGKKQKLLQHKNNAYNITRTHSTFMQEMCIGNVQDKHRGECKPIVGLSHGINGGRYRLESRSVFYSRLRFKVKTVTASIRQKIGEAVWKRS
jgi:hypothetical protein